MIITITTIVDFEFQNKTYTCVINKMRDNNNDFVYKGKLDLFYNKIIIKTLYSQSSCEKKLISNFKELIKLSFKGY